MKLYIDFDGVIVNTMEMIENELKNKKLPRTDQYFIDIDWIKLLDNCQIINEAFNTIKKLMKIYDVAILTHINTLDEGIAKTNFIRKKIEDLNIILVPKSIAKSKIVNPKNAILVDDFGENIEDWIKNGGIGIKFNNKKHLVINDLTEIILKYV
ncbi:MAG: hypothetical protein IJB71_00520 [Bacilli bacterium]|nr:hypothetical protein [Bacilli bacterium]